MDEKTLSAIIEEEKDALFVVAFHYCKNRFDAEDAVQNAMLRLLSAKKPFASREHLRRWLIRVTVNECKRLLMSPWRQRVESLETCRQSFGIVQQEERALFDAVMALPQKYRVVVALYYYQGYSVREVAALLGRRESAVQTQLMRGRQKLKDSLQEVWQDE